MSTPLEFYFDFGSPSSYLAYTQLPGFIERTAASVHLQPVLMGAVFSASGNPSPATIPAKLRYLMTDLQRCARRLGVTLTLNPHFPFATLPLQRIAVGLQQTDPSQFQRFVDAIFKAIWVDGRNLGNPSEVAAVVSAAGLDAATLLKLAEDPDIKASLKQRTDTAVARGLFGLPTFFVGEQMFWGHDRLAHAEEALHGKAFA